VNKILEYTATLNFRR